MRNLRKPGTSPGGGLGERQMQTLPQGGRCGGEKYEEQEQAPGWRPELPPSAPPRKSVVVWFNDILVGALSLPQCAEGMDFAAFRASRPHQAAALRHIREITEAAFRQQPTSRAASRRRLEGPHPTGRRGRRE